MRCVRGSGIASSLTVLFMALALLLPEVGHGLAHHHAAQHHDAAQHHGSSYIADRHGGTGSDLSLTDEQGDGRHPHLDLVAKPPSKPLLAYASAVRAVALLLPDFGEERPLPPAFTTGFSPGRRDHGPPPPSRAPPQV